MLDALLLAALTIVSQVFPALIVDLFKYLGKRNTRVSTNNHS